MPLEPNRAPISGQSRIAFDLNSVDDYRLFLKVKALPTYRFVGRTAEVPDDYLSRLGLPASVTSGTEYRPIPGLFDYQEAIARLAIGKRKFAVFADCGLGKTLVMLEFARHVRSVLGPTRRVLIVSPLMVVRQTMRELKRFYPAESPLEMTQVRAADLPRWITTVGTEIGITNYEALSADVPRGRLGALIVDESSMLKSAYGKWGQEIIRLGKGIDWKLALTGTPAPNDRIEFANHAVFLDAFPTVNSFLARYFVNRGQTDNRWELKPHALRPFYRSLSHWSIFLTNPATYGWRDNATDIPPIHVTIHDVDLTPEQQGLAYQQTGTLFADRIGGITSRSVLSQIAKGNHRGERVATHKPAYIRALVNSWPDESTIIWCCKPDAPVTLANGTESRIADICPGDVVLSGTGKPRVVINRLQRHHAGEMVRIKIRGLCDALELTPEHRLPTSEGWKTAGEIVAGDWLIDGTFGLSKDGGDYDLGWVIGLYLAEGCRSRGPNGTHNTTMFGIHDREAELVVGKLSKVCTSPVKVYRSYNGEQSTTIRSSDSNLRSVVDSWVGGETCYTKHLVQLPQHRDVAMGILDGWLYGDGSSQANAMIGQSSSRNLARQMLLLASSLGFSASLTTGMNRPGPLKRATGAKSSGNDWWRVGVSPRVGHYAQSRLVNGTTYRQVMSVEREDYDGTVYDLTVDVDHTFLAQGIVVSNCHYNAEQDTLAALFPEAANIDGATSMERRQELIEDFQAGRRRVLVSKPRILGFGLNLQVATRQVFSGLQDSYEAFYQAVKRSNRIGSTRPLNVHLPITDIERPMIETVLRKAARVHEDTLEQERMFKDAAL